MGLPNHDHRRNSGRGGTQQPFGLCGQLRCGHHLPERHERISTWVTATSGNEVTAFTGTAVNAGAGFSTTTTSPASLALLGGTGGTASNGKFMVFLFNMSGYANLVVSYATQRTATGYNAQIWEYSTNGTVWTPAQTVNTIPAAFGAITLTTITGLNNAATAYLRFSGQGASSTAGNNRLDNIQLNALVDTDGDGVVDTADNCPGTANPGQENMDGDALGDACDPDDDGDGYCATGLPPGGCTIGGGDCDAADPSIHPGATEVWYDGVDQDCDATSDYDQDADGYDASFGGHGLRRHGCRYTPRRNGDMRR